MTSSTGHVPQGTMGTIVDILARTTVAVEWDTFVNGHNCNHKAKDGYGWNVGIRTIKILDK